MSKNSLSKIALWIALGFVFTGGTVSLLVLAATSGSSGSPDAAPASTSWYVTQPPTTEDDPRGGEPTVEPSGTADVTSGPSELPTPVTVVTHTVVAVNPDSGGGDGPGTLIAAFGSLLSGAAAVGTLLHAVSLSRQNRSAAAADDGPAPARTP